MADRLPAHQRGEAHEDGVDVAAALQAEESTAIVDEVELDVPSAPAELLGAIAVGPGKPAAALDDGNVCREKRVADALDQLALLLPAQIIEEDASYPALGVAVGDEVVLARPLREARVPFRPAGLLQHAVEVRGVLREGPERRQIHAAAKPDRKSTRLNSSHQIISYAVF